MIVIVVVVVAVVVAIAVGVLVASHDLLLFKSEERDRMHGFFYV